MPQRTTYVTDMPTLGLAIVAVLFALAMGLSPLADFGVFYKTALALRTSGWGAVYDVHGITPYHYHPFTTLLFLPFTHLPFAAAKWAWALLNGWWLWDTHRLIKAYFSASAGQVLIALGFCLYPLTWQMKFGNTSVLLVWGLMVALTTRRLWLSDALLAILVLIKLTLVGWLPLLFLTGSFRRGTRIAAWLLGFSFVAWVLGGTTTYESWWLTLHDPITAHNYSKNDNQCWYALTYRLKDVWHANLAFVLGGAFFGLAFLKQIWPDRRNEKAMLVAAILPWLWCGPLSWIHHQILLWPLFVSVLPSRPKPWTSRHTTLVAIWLFINAPTSLFLGGPLSYAAHRWGVPLLGFLLLLVPLSWRPEKNFPKI